MTRRYKRRGDRPSDVDDLKRVNDALFEYDGALQKSIDAPASEGEHVVVTSNEVSADAIDRLLVEHDGKVRRVVLDEVRARDVRRTMAGHVAL